MTYKLDIQNQAKKILFQRKLFSQIDSEKKKEEIYIKIPEVKNINTRLSEIGYETVAIAASPLSKEEKKQRVEKLKDESLFLQSHRHQILIEQGFNENDLEINYKCNKCKDTGFIEGECCSCFYQLLKELQKKEIEKIENIDNYTFQNFSPEYCSSKSRFQNVFNKCRNYASQFSTNSENLFIQGSTGLGKTHLSIAILNKVIDKNYSAVYAPAFELFSDLENEYYNQKAYYKMSDVLKTDLLVIDDLGDEKISQLSKAQLKKIINTRNTIKKPVIITSNFSLYEIEEKYDQRIVSRLLTYTGIKLIGNDVRETIHKI